MKVFLYHSFHIKLTKTIKNIEYKYINSQYQIEYQCNLIGLYSSDSELQNNK